MVAALARYNRENPRGQRDMQYMGGKSRIAKKIREHLVSHGATRYVEPFVGGGAVLTTVARDFQFILAADAHADLIGMYQAIQDGTFTPPETVTEEEYRALRTRTRHRCARSRRSVRRSAVRSGEGMRETVVGIITFVRQQTPWPSQPKRGCSIVTWCSVQRRCLS